MQLPESNITITKSKDIQESSFGISKGNEAHLLGIFRNKLYTNKPAAVIREYATNGLDGHKLNGNENRPLDVHLPNIIFPNFKVRDYGPGLSIDDIYSIYTQYGASTKRSSNDFIGGLGIGCKAAFCYSNIFGITSITKEENGNVKRSYSAYIDETQIGKVALMHEAPTDEETGVEISVPVKQNDFNVFNITAQHVFRYFKVKPNILNADIKWQEEKVISKGDGWSFVAYEGYQARDFVIIMGSIGYKINQNLFTESLKTKEKEELYLISNIIRSGLRLEFNIGELNIAANREDLEYDDKTVQKIKERILGIVEDIKEIINGQIEKADSLLEAKLLRTKLLTQFHYLKMTNKWKNFEIQNDYLFVVPDGVAVYINWSENKYQKIYSSVTVPGSKEVYLGNANLPSDIEKIKFYIKSKDTKQWKRKLNCGKKYDEYRICFEILNDKAWREFCKSHDLDNVDFTFLDKVEIPKEEKERFRNFNKKHNIKCFEFNFDKKSSTKSDHFKEIDLEFTDNIIYIDIHCFMWKTSKGLVKTPAEINKLLLELDLIGLKIPKLYALKSGFKGSRKNMIPLETVIRDYIQDLIEKEPIRDYAQSKAFTRYFQYVDFNFYIKNLDKIVKENSPFKEFVLKFKKCNETVTINEKDENLILLKNRLYKDFCNQEAILNKEKGYNYIEKVDLLRSKYPLLHQGNLIIPTNSYNVEQNIDHIIDYINYIDLKE